MCNYVSIVTSHCTFCFTVPAVIHFPGNITGVCRPLTVNETQNAVLVCNATGNPVPNIAWTGKHVGTGSPLTIPSITKNNAGIYTCTADNGIGNNDSRCWNLTVQCKFVSFS